MDSFITLKTFTYPSEAYILRGKLESEGISCFIKDEFTVQSNPMYSNAVGGVKLQVQEVDLEKAIEILKAGGYTLDDYSQPPKFYLNFARISDKIPLFNKIPELFRVLIIFVILVCGILYSLMWLITKLVY